MISAASVVLWLRLTAAQHLLFVREAIAPHLTQGESKGDHLNQTRYDPDHHCYVHPSVNVIPRRDRFTPSDRAPSQTVTFFADLYRQALAEAIAKQYRDIEVEPPSSAEAKAAAEAIACSCRTRISFSPTQSTS
jgi:hypothetical protein